MKPSVYYIFVKTKITVDFHICISVPLIDAQKSSQENKEPVGIEAQLPPLPPSPSQSLNIY